MFYPNSEKIEIPKDLKLSLELQRKARDWYQQRSDRTFKIWMICALCCLVFPPLGILIAIFAILYRKVARALIKKGVFVPAVPINSFGKVSEHTTAADAWEEDSKMAPTGNRNVDRAFSTANQVALSVGEFAPAVIAHYQFDLKGKTYRVGKYMFTGDTFFKDDTGWHWALAHPKYPRFNNWLVSIRS